MDDFSIVNTKHFSLTSPAMRKERGREGEGKRGESTEEREKEREERGKVENADVAVDRISIELYPILEILCDAALIVTHSIFIREGSLKILGRIMSDLSTPRDIRRLLGIEETQKQKQV